MTQVWNEFDESLGINLCEINQIDFIEFSVYWGMGEVLKGFPLFSFAAL